MAGSHIRSRSASPLPHHFLLLEASHRLYSGLSGTLCGSMICVSLVKMKLARRTTRRCSTHSTHYIIILVLYCNLPPGYKNTCYIIEVSCMYIQDILLSIIFVISQPAAIIVLATKKKKKLRTVWTNSWRKQSVCLRFTKTQPSEGSKACTCC